MFFILLIVIYLIYKIFVFETEVFILNEKMTKLELELNNSDTTNTCKINNNVKLSDDDLNVSEIIMNEIFNDTNMNVNANANVEKPIVVDIDIEKKQEEVFDLKKETKKEEEIELESISSNVNNTNKKKLLKLNLDKLKEKCTEMGLSTDGTKTQLIDRILDN
jgi:hypothetical protein